MNWEKVGKLSLQFVLSVIEWGFKICAFVAGALTTAATGSFGDKIATGFGSLSEGLRQLFNMPIVFNKVGWTAREYHQMGPIQFQEAYGLNPVDQLMASLNGFFGFFNQISINISQTPFTSLAATFIVSVSFYFLGRVIRFARQKGRSSYLCRFEQRLGDQVFNRDTHSLKQKVRDFKEHHEAQKRMRQSSPELT